MRYWTPKKIPGTPLVGVAAAAYFGKDRVRAEANLRGLVAAFQSQTYDRWLLHVVHDGPVRHWPTAADIGDHLSRVAMTATEKRLEKFGHPHRQAAVDRLLAAGCDWVGLTNQDNYYVPVYLEWLLHAAVTHKALFVYCDCVHSHTKWQKMDTKPRRGKLDLGGFLAHKSIAEKVKFDNHTFAGDGDYINRLVATAGKRVEKVPALLFTHN